VAGGKGKKEESGSHHHVELPSENRTSNYLHRKKSTWLMVKEEKGGNGLIPRGGVRMEERKKNDLLERLLSFQKDPPLQPVRKRKGESM